MENKITTFNPVGKRGRIDWLNRIKSVITEGQKEFNLTIDLSEITELIEKETATYDKRIAEFVDFLKDCWGKYYNLKFSYNANYSDTRETEPKWQIDREYNMLLYRYMPTSGLLLGVSSSSNINFSGVTDYSLHVNALLEDHKLEIQEITEEDFIKKAQDEILKPLKTRLDKIESGYYKLTDLGYLHIDDVLI